MDEKAIKIETRNKKQKEDVNYEKKIWYTTSIN